MITIPKEIHEIINRINVAGYEAFIVGGFVRDALLGIESYDVDIASNADIKNLNEIFETKASDTYGNQYGLMKLKRKDYSIEITHYRKESDYKDFRHPNKIEFVQTIKEDAKRRDFTINALYYHPDLGIFDFYGGISDLENKTVRSIGEPMDRFKEDPLRILRLFRFSSQLNFDIEKKTKVAALNLIHLVKELKPKQIYKELSKILMSKKFLSLALEYPALFSSMIPELGKAHDFDQENPYHRYSLYEHTMRVVDACPYDLNLRLAALFHDLGKLETRTRDAKGISHFRYHAHHSMLMTKPYLDGYEIKMSDKQMILKLIDLHDYKLKPNTASIYDFLVNHSYIFVQDLIYLKRADNMAKSDLADYQVDKCHQFELILNDIKNRKLPLGVSELSVYPKDLMDLGIEGKDISNILNMIFTEVKDLELGNDRLVQMEILERVVENGIY